MYYMPSDYRTSIFGKNCAYYIQIFTVSWSEQKIVLRPWGQHTRLRPIIYEAKTQINYC